MEFLMFLVWLSVFLLSVTLAFIFLGAGVYIVACGADADWLAILAAVAMGFLAITAWKNMVARAPTFVSWGEPPAHEAPAVPK